MEKPPDCRCENEDARAAGPQPGGQLTSPGGSSAPPGKPELPRKLKVRLRLFLASLLCLLTLAVTIPNLGHLEEGTQTIRWGIEDVVSVIIILTPLLLVFVGYDRSRIVEGVGWLSLIAMLILRFSF